MSNTKVKVIYSNGSEREFLASDELEALINEGEMFSITTMHSDMGQVEELAVSKMYAGNPVAAMGHMMMMKRNAENLRDAKVKCPFFVEKNIIWGDEDDVLEDSCCDENRGDDVNVLEKCVGYDNCEDYKRHTENEVNKEAEHMSVVIETINACIQFLSNEVTSHQSGMVDMTQLDVDGLKKSIDEANNKPFFCGNKHENTNTCLHLCNLDNSCIEDEKCEGYIPF